MKKSLSLLALTLFSIGSMADDVSSLDATRIAEEFMHENTSKNKVKGQAMSRPLRLIYSRSEEGAPLYHVFNRTGGGFVVVAGADDVRPVLAYSASDTIADMTLLPPAMQEMLEKYAASVRVIRKGRSDGYIIDESDIPDPTTAVEPMLVTEWDQGAPYNQLCPYNGGRCLTGCVATAMAQLMYYYKYPEKGTGSHSYQWRGRTLSTDFSSHTYDWKNMLPTYKNVSSTTAQKTAVAQLMSDCGIACEAEYGTSVTIAAIYRQFVDFFGYDSSSAWMYKNRTSNVQWEKVINDELLAGQPVYYCARNDDDSMGHLFLLDGCDEDNYYHINWGWGGYQDSYYTITFPYRLGEYWDSACCIIGLKPGTETSALDFTAALPYQLEVPAVGLTMDYSDNYLIGNFANHSTTATKIQQGFRLTNVSTGKSAFYLSGEQSWDAKQENEWYWLNFGSEDLQPGLYDVEPAYRLDDDSEWQTFRNLRNDIKPARVQLLGNIEPGNAQYTLVSEPIWSDVGQMDRSSYDYVSLELNVAPSNLMPQEVLFGLRLTDTNTQEVEYLPCSRKFFSGNQQYVYFSVYARDFSHAGTFEAVPVYRDAHWGGTWKELKPLNGRLTPVTLTVTGESNVSLIVEDLDVGSEEGISAKPLTMRARVRAIRDIEGQLRFHYGSELYDEPLSMKAGETKEFTVVRDWPEAQGNTRYIYHVFLPFEYGISSGFNERYFFVDADETPVEHVRANAAATTSKVDVFLPSGICVRRQVEESQAVQGLPDGIYMIRQGVLTRKVVYK